MKKKKFPLCMIATLTLLLAACNHQQANEQKPKPQEQAPIAKENTEPAQPEENIKSIIVKKYENQQPKEWGEHIPGVYKKLDTKDKVVALTFDACGGAKGSGYDKDIIDYLQAENIPATLFINSRWIDANQETFMYLAQQPLFEIENHGYHHQPLSANGRSAWGIAGTRNVGEMVDEVYLNQNKIKNLTGRKPQFFRSGTAFYDDIGIKVVEELGEKAVNYNVLGDAGATYNKEQVKKAILSAVPGSIIILHMNQPRGETAEGLKLALPELKKRGYRFAKLADYALSK